MDKFFYEEIVLIPVAKADFSLINKFAEMSLISRHPHEEIYIKEDREKLLDWASRQLKSYREEEEASFMANLERLLIERDLQRRLPIEHDLQRQKKKLLIRRNSIH
jgi:hypothetical protein